MFKSAANGFFKDLEKICVYEGVNRLKYVRCFGIFCAAHSVLWGYLAYDRDGLESVEQKLKGSLKIQANPKPSFFSKYDWYQSYLTMVKNVREKLRLDQMYPVITTMTGLSCLLFGFFVPRRLVRQMSLIVTKVDNTSKIEKYIEINTYGAFGIREQGVMFRKPLNEIQFRHKLQNAELTKLTMQVKNIPIVFLLDLKVKQYINEEELHCLIYGATDE